MIPQLELVALTSATARRPLLVVGPSLGTSVTALWQPCADLLAADFDVVGWDLPGHGDASPATAPFTVAELAAGVLAAVEAELARRGTPRAQFAYAGDSLGGAVGLVLLLEQPERVAAAALACTGARIGTTAGWHERAAAVRQHGMAYMIDRSPAVWFGPGFREREPAASAHLVDVLAHVDADSYAYVCEALAGFDVRDRLGDIDADLTLVAGAADTATTVVDMRELADWIRGATLEVLDGVAHLAPIEAPRAVADAILAAADPTRRRLRHVHDAGMGVRRAVAGDPWVDRAHAGTTDFTREFQQFITTFAWGSIWTRPGLDRRSRSMITLTALVARGHQHELAMHVRGALANGLTRDEIGEVLLQSAIYCGVPDANTAFRVAQGVFDEIDAEQRRATPRRT